MSRRHFERGIDDCGNGPKDGAQAIQYLPGFSEDDSSRLSAVGIVLTVRDCGCCIGNMGGDELLVRIMSM